MWSVKCKTGVNHRRKFNDSWKWSTSRLLSKCCSLLKHLFPKRRLHFRGNVRHCPINIFSHRRPHLLGGALTGVQGIGGRGSHRAIRILFDGWNLSAPCCKIGWCQVQAHALCWSRRPVTWVDASRSTRSWAPRPSCRTRRPPRAPGRPRPRRQQALRSARRHPGPRTGTAAAPSRLNTHLLMAQVRRVGRSHPCGPPCWGSVRWPGQLRPWSRTPPRWRPGPWLKYQPLWYRKKGAQTESNH